MRRSLPATAPRSARKPRETSDEKKARVLQRAEELTAVIRRGWTPEETIEKGEALIELKRLRPWKYGKQRGSFRDYIWTTGGLKVAVANKLIRIAKGLRRDEVAGRKLCFDSLVAIADAPVEMHPQLIQEAEARTSARRLRMIAEGREAPAPDSPEACLERLLRKMRGQAAELRVLKDHLDKGFTPPEQVLLQIQEGAAIQQQLIGNLGALGPETDRNRSTSESEPRSGQGDSGFSALCVDYQPAPLKLRDLDLPIPSEWPPDWFAQWVRTPPIEDPILLCADGPAEQRGTLGLMLATEARVGLDLEKNFCGFLFGEGHTQAADGITHMSVDQVHHISNLPYPLCAIEVICAPHAGEEAEDPRSLWLRHPNRDHEQVQSLIEEMGATPVGLEDIVLICHEERVQPLRERHPHVRVFPFPQGRYQMPDLIRPGRLIIVDPRGAGLSRQEELGLGQVALANLTRRDQGREVGLLVRVDEVHEALAHDGLAELLGLLVREREERDLRLLLQTGDPRAVPQDLLAEADLIGVGRIQGKRPLAWLTKARPAFAMVDPRQLARFKDRVMVFLAREVWVQQREETREDCLVEVQVRPATAGPPEGTGEEG